MRKCKKCKGTGVRAFHLDAQTGEVVTEKICISCGGTGENREIEQPKEEENPWANDLRRV